MSIFCLHLTKSKTVNVVKEIVIYGGISSMIYLIFNRIIFAVFPANYDFWIYDSLTGFLISLCLLIISRIYFVKELWFSLLLRYLFSNFIILTIYNFIFSMKITLGIVKFCIAENVNNEALYQHIFASNFIVFLATFCFTLIFKLQKISIFSKASVIYIFAVLALTVVLRAQIYLEKVLNWIV